MTTNKPFGLSGLQLRRVWQLARRHKHEWARWIKESDLDGSYTPIELKQLAVQGAAEARQEIQGLGSINIQTNGTVVHQSHRGRIRWEVSPEGTTTITVSRSTGDLLEALISDKIEHVEQVGPPYLTIHHRHVNALRTALDAIVGDEVSRQATQYWYDRAEPDW